MNEKRQQILEAALKLFVNNGFHATPTTQIAKEAGVATGTLFHYFKTKEELINTLYLETKEELTRELSANVDEQASIKGKLRQLFFNAIHWALAYPNQQAFYYQYSYSPFISQITKELGEQRLQFVYEIIEEGKATDILKDVPTQLLFDSSLGIINGIVKYSLEQPGKMQDNLFMEQAFTLFWDALKG